MHDLFDMETGKNAFCRAKYAHPDLSLCIQNVFHNKYFQAT